MKNKIPVLALLIIITVIPQVASAAWWNPLSWFKDELPLPVEQTANVNQSLEVLDEESTVANEPQVIEKEVIKEVIKTVTIPVEKVVTVQDQSVIEENNKLKGQIKELQTKLDQLTNDLKQAQAKIKAFEAGKTQNEAQRQAYLVELANLDIEIGKVRAGQYDHEICRSNIQSCDESFWRTNSTSRPPQHLIDMKIGSFETRKAQVQLELLKLQ